MAKNENAKSEIDLIIASQPNWKGELLAQLRSIVLSASKEIGEDVKWKMPSKPLGSPTWEVNGIVCVADYLKNAVRLTFPKGAQIDDKDQLFNSRLDSKTVRAIDFFEGEKLKTAALKRLVKLAIAVNKS
jgi:hypothetical protein